MLGRKLANKSANGRGMSARLLLARRCDLHGFSSPVSCASASHLLRSTDTKSQHPIFSGHSCVKRPQLQCRLSDACCRGLNNYKKFGSIIYAIASYASNEPQNGIGNR